MTRRLPPEAFDYYVNLGPGRSYQAVADHYGVIKQTVTRRATHERWQEQLAAIERKARQRREQKTLESIAQMQERHLKTLRVMQAKGLETLRAMPLATAMDAVRTLDLAIRQERTIRGEPGERTQVDIEQIIRGEYERWMAPENGQDAEGAGAAGGAATGDPAGGIATAR